MKGDGSGSKEHPSVWLDAFEKHRKAGDKTIVFDEQARAEIEESDVGGAVYEVCVDAKATSRRSPRR